MAIVSAEQSDARHTGIVCPQCRRAIAELQGDQDGIVLRCPGCGNESKVRNPGDKKPLADWIVNGVITLALPFIGSLGGVWKYIAGLGGCVFFLYLTIHYLGGSLGEWIHSTLRTPTLSINPRQNAGAYDATFNRRYVRNIAACGAIAIVVVIWFSVATVLYTVPSAPVRALQLIGQFLAPEAIVLGGRATSEDVAIAPDVVIPVIPTVNPFEQVRSAAAQFEAERDAAIAERDSLRRQVAAASQRPTVSLGATPAPANPQPQPPSPTVAAGGLRANTPEPTPPTPTPVAATTTPRILTNEEQDAIDLLNQRIAAGSLFLSALKQAQNVATSAMKSELTNWVNDSQGRLRANKVLGPLVNAAFVERNGNWDDPLAQLNSMLGYLQSKRDELLRPTQTVPPLAPSNLQVNP